MQFSANQINQLIKGEIVGNAAVIVSNFAKIEEAKEGDLCFLANPKYTSHVYTTKASIIIANQGIELTDTVRATLILVEDAYSAFTLLLEKYNNEIFQKTLETGIEPQSYIHPSAKIGKNVYIAAFAYIGENAVVGDHCQIHSGVHLGKQSVLGEHSTLFSGVKVYHQVVIGKNVIVHANAVIGSDGFGFAPQADGTYHKIPQTGNVIIEDAVEIGANTCIDRATMGSTIIKKGVKLDNMVQIAHNVEIDSDTVIAAQTGISGSTKIGKNCVFGGQTGIVGHISIAKGSKFGAKSGINKTIKEENKTWNGNPIMPYNEWRRTYALLRKLTELNQQITHIEKQLATLNKNERKAKNT